MKASYFVFLCVLLCSASAIKLKKTQCKGCPLTAATTTTTPATTTTTPATTTTTTPTTTTTTTTPASTTTTTTTTTPAATSGSIPAALHGVWVLAEDNTVPMAADWYPKLGSNYPFDTYWLSFLNPNTIFTNGAAVTPSAAFTKFSSTRGVAGSPKATDKVLYSIGGYSYSQPDQVWSMFDSNANAIAFAKAVVSWKANYKMDGFDLDWETASATPTQVQAVYTFLTTIKSLDPNLIITVEEGGYPQFMGAALIQYANSIGQIATLMKTVDFFNVMYYSAESQNSLYWVQSSWQKDCTNWCALGFKVPSNKIILGLPGCCDAASTAASLKSQICSKGTDGLSYGGFMVWYTSSAVTPNIVYGGVCAGSLGCQMPSGDSAKFTMPTC